MSEKAQVLIQRFMKGKCPICNQLLPDAEGAVKVKDFNGIEFKVCGRHKGV